MPIKKIITIPDPILRQVSEPVKSVDNEINDINDMSSDYKARNHKLRVQRLLEMYKEQIDLDKIEDNFENYVNGIKNDSNSDDEILKQGVRNCAENHRTASLDHYVNKMEGGFKNYVKKYFNPPSKALQKNALPPSRR